MTIDERPEGSSRCGSKEESSEVTAFVETTFYGGADFGITRASQSSTTNSLSRSISLSSPGFYQEGPATPKQPKK
jgi:hypothetical protein